ncbi:MAG: beta-propeller fold lactonase family protein [Deltaproteobacteria bacterium]|nr:beta-propeller fold lactonase family protein [Deltaproteobacteria bacterium]MBW2166541.1 beta-propeller fold lactonase family protein [Deltaproteobacteria bacterium]MBW2570051.1 beta-propeller fold lactonase family protein [Deltaproteobacteria bacterium]
MSKTIVVKPLKFRLIMLVLAAVSIQACIFEPTSMDLQLANKGQVFFYLSCPQKPTFDISFSISGMSLMNKEGEWIDVAVDKRIHSAGLAQNQIKLQEFYLPAGKYERIKWTISETNLKKDGKIFSLATPQPGGNHFFDMEFSVFSGESFAIFADWNPEESVFDKYLFKPKMTLRKQGIEIKNILLYVTNSDSNCVTVIDRQHDRVVAAIAVNQSPMGIVASPDGNKIYVANSGSNNISVIDTGLNRVINTIGNFGYSPAELALSGDGLTLYATNPNSNNISVIDTLSNIVTGWIYVGNDPADIVVDQDRCKVYVVNKASNSVSIVNVNTSAVENTVPVGFNPTGVAIHQDKLYVTNADSNSISVIDIPSYLVTKTISLSQKPMWLVSGLSKRIYVSCADNEVSFIYPSMDMTTRNISVGDLPSQMAVDSFRKKLYVVNTMSEDLSVIDLATKRVKTVIQVGRRPHGIALIEE